MTNLELARQVLSDLIRKGAHDFCVCAGSRNSPLLALLGAARSLRMFSFADERCAAFFALGRTKFHGAPCVVVTTSGTAVAELLPAVVEAHYSKQPLVVVTADRPARFRGTGAPQCIEQDGIFGPFAARSLETWSGHGPLHLNLEFDEPLVDGKPFVNWDAVPAALTRPVPKIARSETDIPFDRPLVIIGGLRPQEKERVRAFALKLGRTVYAEPLSGLREDEQLRALLLTSGERMLSRIDFDGVVRVGAVPVLRFWRDLDERLSHVPVVHFTDSFVGLTRGDAFPFDALPADPAPRSGADAGLALDRQMVAALETLFAEEPESEPAVIRQLSATLPPNARVYLGNSLPIREWDLAAVREGKQFVYAANRGANGIDGQVSTFLGQCDPARPNACVIGDLTAICDSGAGWIVPQLDPAIAFTIYIVNNAGGKIFSRVASMKSMDDDVRARIVENRHTFDFRHWGAMWGLEYGDASGRRGIVELRPDADATTRFWQRYDELWATS